MTTTGCNPPVSVSVSDDEFHESLDRILSSSCSSTSASDSDSDHRRPRPSSYDVWVSQPSSVEERRRLLLQRLGLVGDPSLSRSNPSPDPVPPKKVVFRSRSDGSVCHRRGAKPPLAKSASGNGDGDEGSDLERMCTIKDLDSGVKFVVKEVREDGTWNKLREVGTGRQLTMEEFKRSVIGHSPIVEELMRRQSQDCGGGDAGGNDFVGSGGGSRVKKKGSWLRSIRSMAGTVVSGGERKSGDEKDTGSDKGGRRSSSATDDSQDGHSHRSHCGSERVRVRHYGGSWKELTGLYMNQEVLAHSGSIWCMKFSLDGKYLASAGEDCVIHVWQVVETERKRDLMAERGLWDADSVHCFSPFTPISNGTPDLTEMMPNFEGSYSERKRKSKVPGARRSFSLDHVIMPENVFALSEKPIRSFRGHQKDVLDLSWSKSKLLLSSSMDKTVRLWDMSSNACLKTFSHSDYVTCIQFNPVNDKYFLSGALDAKVRLWSIEHRQVVDWVDLHEMVTAACFTPDGQGALVGSHKGTCNFYDTSGNKLQQLMEIDLQNKKKKSHLKKITGFQFAPRSLSEVLVTSADSRIRVVDDLELAHKFKGFRNTSSQISASFTSDGKHVVCASEDSQVYVWRNDPGSRHGRSKGVVTSTQSYEYFQCRDVSVAIAWPGSDADWTPNTGSNGTACVKGLSKPRSHFLADVAYGQPKSPLPAYKGNGNSQKPFLSSVNSNHFCDRVAATWPEEKLVASPIKQSPRISELASQIHNRSAWGMVIVTAGRGGEIKVFQNFGYPVRV